MLFRSDTLKFSTKSLAFNKDRDLSVYESDSSYSKQKYFDQNTDLIVKVDTQSNKKKDKGNGVNFRRMGTEDDIHKQKYGNTHLVSKVKRKSMVNYLQRRNSFFEEEGSSINEENVNFSNNIENNTNQLMLKENKNGSSLFKVLNLNFTNDKVGSNSNSKIIDNANKNIRLFTKK